MPFTEIIGQETPIRILQTGLRNKKLSHAYLFSGPAGIGKKALAMALAKAVFCEANEENACGTCRECRKMESGNHPFLFVVQPDGASLKIDQMRDLQKRFTFKGEEMHVAIIEQAERMTIQAANSLLKFLEEPRARSLVILLTENRQAILPTIQSRLQCIALNPLSPKRMEQILLEQGYHEAYVKCAVRMAASTSGATSLIEQEWFAEIRSLMIQLAKESYSGFSAAALTLQKHWAKARVADYTDAMLDFFTIWFRDFIHIRSEHSERVTFVDQLDWLTAHAFKQKLSFWIACMDHAAEAKKRLRYNVNPQLALEQFLIRIQGE